MVEADYRMKLIGIGLETAAGQAGQLRRARQAGRGRRNAMQRWFFVPDYKCVCQSDDKLAMELVGDGVKLVGEDEVVMANGERRQAAGRRQGQPRFRHQLSPSSYPELAERSPVYAELRNLIDLSIAAAYIQEQGYYEKSDWKMPFFGSEQEFPVEVYSIPKTVEIGRQRDLERPVADDAHRRRRHHRGHPSPEGRQSACRQERQGGKTREGVKLNLAKGQWWWD